MTRAAALRAACVWFVVAAAVLLLSLSGCAVDTDDEGRRLGIGLIFFAIGFTLGRFGGHRRRPGERDE